MLLLLLLLLMSKICEFAEYRVGEIELEIDNNNKTCNTRQHGTIFFCPKMKNIKDHNKIWCDDLPFNIYVTAIVMQSSKCRGSKKKVKTYRELNIRERERGLAMEDKIEQ